MTTLHEWTEELRAAALVGTARREAPAVPAGWGLAARPPGSREQALLSAAALADVVARTGTRPPVEAVPFEVAPSDDLPVVGQRAEQLLDLLLGQSPFGAAQTKQMVAAWLAHAVRTGQRVPPRLLPGLLTSRFVPASARADLAAAIGARGRWFAALHPDVDLAAADSVAGQAVAGQLGGALPPDWTTLWTALPVREAVELLTRARAHDPQQARAALEQHVGTYGAKQRADLLAVLAVGLSPDDEPLLESALDDRAAGVRRRAAGLLADLPGSARSQRMGARLAGLLTVSGALRRRLEVAVPDAPDAAGVRDGLAPAKGTPTVQQRAGWLRQLVEEAPLTTWTDVTDRPPAATVAMLRGDTTLLGLLTEAVVRTRDPEWAQALHGAGVADPRLHPLLPAATRRTLVLAGLAKRPLPPATGDLLRAGPHPWEPEVARAVLQALADPQRPEVVHHVAPVLAHALPADVHADVRSLVDRVHGIDRRKLLADVLQLHEFQHTLTEAFR
ncbi:hypothetical protein IEQ44_08005 [Nocardioides sp. Y6]|uniref:HEAT repeat domain-containing protein n=1 Tax=Nocardioides malaquae TaxID=2773426 RepID=A0ABR9RSN9_9ACTN|nr:DUF5691 domain-containing protein [Nocardioides malaquae]MBE7324593.1 hypothetical protein [Nocardioides malaquae]